MGSVDECTAAAAVAAAAAARAAAAAAPAALGEPGSGDGSVGEKAHKSQADAFLFRFLSEAVEGVPLPSPWEMQRDNSGQVFFANWSTGAASWRHPLQAQLDDVAAVCRACLLMSSTKRAEAAAKMKEFWEIETRAEISKWYPARDRRGRIYHCHQESGETRWEHPADVLLPGHFMRSRAADRLLEDSYITRLRADTVLEIRKAAMDRTSVRSAKVSAAAFVPVSAANTACARTQPCLNFASFTFSWKESCLIHHRIALTLLFDTLLAVFLGNAGVLVATLHLAFVVMQHSVVSTQKATDPAAAHFAEMYRISDSGNRQAATSTNCHVQRGSGPPPWKMTAQAQPKPAALSTAALVRPECRREKVTIAELLQIDKRDGSRDKREGRSPRDKRKARTCATSSKVAAEQSPFDIAAGDDGVIDISRGDIAQVMPDNFAQWLGV